MVGGQKPYSEVDKQMDTKTPKIYPPETNFCQKGRKITKSSQKRTKILKYSHIIIVLVHKLIPYGEVDMQEATKGANLSDL